MSEADGTGGISSGPECSLVFREAIDFYLSLGAKPMDEWTVYRITGETLEEMGR